MRWRFEWVYRFVLIALLATAGWAVWAEVQGKTNVPAPANPAPVIPVNATNGLDLHALTFNLDQIEFLRAHDVLGQPLWKYLASLIYILLAFYTAKLLDYIVNVWLKRWASRTETKYDDLLLELLHGPVKVVTLVIFLQVGLGIFDWPERAQIYLSRGFIVIVACSVTYVALKLLDLLLGLWRERIVSAQDRVFAEQLFPLLRKVAKAGIIIAAALITAETLQIEIKSLLAGLSIGGLALGLAAQDTVANLFGAVAIFLDRPFYIGDRIKVEGVDGIVEGIGLRSTRIRNLDGHHVTVPNKLMGNAIITNVTRRPSIKTEINLGLTYDTPAEKVKRATVLLEEIFQANPRTLDLIISFNKFGDSALNIFIVHVWSGTDAKAHFADLQEINLQIKQRFEAEKIEMAFPTQTLFLKSEAK
jgi:MscS family membrane protein